MQFTNLKYNTPNTQKAFLALKSGAANAQPSASIRTTKHTEYPTFMVTERTPAPDNSAIPDSPLATIVPFHIYDPFNPRFGVLLKRSPNGLSQEEAGRTLASCNPLAEAIKGSGWELEPSLVTIVELENGQVAFLDVEGNSRDAEIRNLNTIVGVTNFAERKIIILPPLTRSQITDLQNQFHTIKKQAYSSYAINATRAASFLSGERTLEQIKNEGRFASTAAVLDSFEVHALHNRFLDEKGALNDSKSTMERYNTMWERFHTKLFKSTFSFKTQQDREAFIRRALTSGTYKAPNAEGERTYHWWAEVLRNDKSKHSAICTADMVNDIYRNTEARRIILKEGFTAAAQLVEDANGLKVSTGAPKVVVNNIMRLNKLMAKLSGPQIDNLAANKKFISDAAKFDEVWNRFYSSLLSAKAASKPKALSANG